MGPKNSIKMLYFNKNTENKTEEKETFNEYAQYLSNDIENYCNWIHMLFNILTVMTVPSATRNEGIIDQQALSNHVLYKFSRLGPDLTVETPRHRNLAKDH